MYTDYWRLKEKPFENALDPRYTYMSPQHKEGLARLLYTAEQRKPGAILLGACGTGKSLVRNMFLNKLKTVGNFAVAVVDNPLADVETILTDIYAQIIGKPAGFSSFGAAFRELREALSVKLTHGYYSLVLVDDAHLLSDVDRLEQLGLLMNLHTDGGQPLVSLVVSARSDWIDKINQCPGFSQRIPNRWTVTPFSLEQTRQYITHRLSVAGGNAWIISDEAVAAIHRFTGGVARCINNIGDLALYLGMSESVVTVDETIVERIVKDWQVASPVVEEG